VRLGRLDSGKPDTEGRLPKPDASVKDITVRPTDLLPIDLHLHQQGYINAGKKPYKDVFRNCIRRRNAKVTENVPVFTAYSTEHTL
jgi:hypothetical protein